MAFLVNISQILGSEPFNIYACDFNGTNCQFISTINESDLPFSFELPSVLSESSYCISIIDDLGCDINNCSAVTPTVTPSNTVTPTMTMTVTQTPTNTVTPSPTRPLVYYAGVECCDGTIIQLYDITYGDIISDGDYFYISGHSVSDPNQIITGCYQIKTSLSGGTIYEVELYGDGSANPYLNCSSCLTDRVLACSLTPTPTFTQTPTNTASPTNTITPTNSETPTNTPTNTVTPTTTLTPTNTPTPTNTTISTPAIAGVTAPVTGATPVTTTTAGTGYTGTVSWSGSPSTFAAATTYTATITLTPTSGYTLTGVTANFFTVTGASPVTHSADSGVITAVFPATASSVKEITAFTVSGQSGSSTITSTGNTTGTIAITVPSATNVTALVATFTHTGSSIAIASVAQVSATTANNFTSPVSYVVTAADGSTKSWSVTITVADLIAQSSLSITTLTTNTKAYPYSQALSISTSGGSGSGATTFAIASGGTATGCALSNSTATATITATTVGRCLIQANKAADSTYSAITSPTTTFTFTTATQTITFSTPSTMTVGSSTQTVAPTASSSLTVTLTSTTTGICTVAGFVITAVAAGTCSITASQAGDGNFSAATNVIRTFAIQANQTITFTTPSDMAVGGTTQIVAPTASSSLTISLASTSTGVCTVTDFVITAVASGTCSITASQAGNANFLAATDVTRTFAISGPATAAAITTQPTGAGSGSVLGTQPVIRIIDSGGNTVTTSTVNVVASISSGTGTLSGTTTVTASSGIAIFTNLVLTGTVGAFTLTFTPTSLTSVTSNSLTITAGPASKVAITRAAVGTQRRTAFTTQPQITIQDASDNTITSSTAVVTASITSGASGSFIGSNTSTAVSGVATFTGLGIDGTIGTTYTITYTVSGLTVATATVNLTGTTCDGIFACQVGDTGPGGGKIFYAADTPFNCGASSVGSTITPKATTTCYYLEVAPSNWNGESDPTKLWAVASNQGTNIPGIVDDENAYNNSLGIGRGLQNSLYIVAQGNDTTTAAGAARGYTVGPINDWYLPTTAELNLLCQWANGIAPSVTTRCTGGSLNSSTYGAASAGFVEAFYYSSSERDAYDYGVNMAWAQDFTLGFQASTGKTSTPFVRPIRAFGVPITISVAAISGVTAPVTGATPVSTTTAGTGYTGTVSWSGSPSTFAAATVYTATITLTPTAGYTLTGVTANFFSVAGGAPVTHSANSGVITAVFYMVGSTGPGGGKIFYLNPGGFACGPTRTSGCSYLEVAPGNWNGASDPTRPWALSGYQNTDVSGIANDSTAYNNVLGIGLGYKNSIDIVAQGNNTNTAAGVARAYTGGSKNDWYLPTAAELNLLCQWQGGVAPSVTTLCAFTSTNSATYGAQSAGFYGDYYWSSSEVGNSNAWSQRFASNTGFQANINKFNTISIRPIRAFGP